MSTPIIRPASVPYPNVWLTFEAPDDNGDLVQYRIQDLPEDRFEDAVKHMQANFLLDESLCRARNMANDEQTVIDFTNIWRETIRDYKLSLVCFEEGSDDIVGMNVLYVEEKNGLSDWSGFKSEHIKDMEMTANHLLDQFNVFEHYKVDRYLSAFGLSVMPWYRGRGIAKKLLEARKNIGRACGLTLTSNLFSSPISQRLAEKAGFEKNFELSFEELAKKGSHYTWNVSNNSTFAIYSMRI
ncbi:uncharacterized protein LOC119066601 [Bradysia coprophila]|uniref:uncharacterized protein LOC119066601 n=1 Tax=Bradysia coprophila TaxID=38358 RepID=UPI00187DBDB6|nr:uncharacterized protein LOC119066601 [Bradysia coprophila]